MVISAEEIVKKYKNVFGDKIIDADIQETTRGVLKQKSQKILRMKMEGDIFHDAFSMLCDISYPHVSAPMTFKLHEERMELIYVFSIYWGLSNYSELPIVFKVMIDRKNPQIQSIADLLPGMRLYERETIEMLGIDILGAEDKRHFLIPPSVYNDADKNLTPFRQDLGFGFDDYYKRLEEKMKEKEKKRTDAKDGVQDSSEGGV